MKLGIIGLPQSGKTTIFNAVTRGNAPTTASAGRFEVHTAVVDVPDPRVTTLSKMFNPKKTIYAKMTYADIAGLETGMYLQEMGNIPLLSREEEVAIAKEIEAGEKQIKSEVFSSPLALRSVISLGEKLKQGEIEPRQVFGDDEEEVDACGKEDQRVEFFLGRMGPLKRLAHEREKLEQALHKRLTVKEREKTQKKLHDVREKIQVSLAALPLGRKHITALAEKLKEIGSLLDQRHTLCERQEALVKHKSSEILSMGRLLKAGGSQAVKLTSQLGKLTASQVVDGGFTAPMWFDGANSGHIRDVEFETPAGGPMCWVGDRLWVAVRNQVFASDIANLPRIVTLNNMSITSGKGGNLSLDATAKTYRYLDQDEIAAQRKAKQPAKGPAK